MISLLKKDLLLIAKSLNVFMVLPLILVLITTSSNPNYMVLMAPLVISIVSATELNIITDLDEKASWEHTLSYLPLTPHQIAGSRYLLFGFLTIFSLVLSLVVSSIICLVVAVPYDFMIMGLVLGFSMTIIYGSILIPVLYRFGISKSIYVLFSILGVGLLAFFILHSWGVDILGIIRGVDLLIGWISLGIALLGIMVASFLCSVQFVSRYE